MADITKELLKNISRVFRYVLPGVFVVAAAHESHPSWFRWLELDKLSHLAAIMVVAIVAGNTWFAFHRFGIQQIVDLLSYCAGLRGPAAQSPSWVACKTYLDDLGKYVARSFLQPAEREPLRNHVEFRASNVVLMYIASEVVFLCALRHEPDTIYSRHPELFGSLGVIGFLCATWQSIITRRIDWYAQNPPE